MKQAIDNFNNATENLMTALAETMDAMKEIQKKLESVELTPQGEWLDVNEHTAEKRCSNCGRVTQKTEYCHGCGSHNMGVDKHSEV